MTHSESSIGLECFMSGARWCCIDLGTRTEIAIKLEYDDPRWYAGPPTYAHLMHSTSQSGMHRMC